MGVFSYFTSSHTLFSDSKFRAQLIFNVSEEIDKDWIKQKLDNSPDFDGSTVTGNLLNCSLLIEYLSMQNLYSVPVKSVAWQQGYHNNG